MPDSVPQFQNVILCDDVREELGNKKSLMGVIGGDLIVGELPATIQLAFFAEYIGEPGKAKTITLSLLQDEEEIARAGIDVPKETKGAAILVLPKAFVKFERECTFRIKAIDGETETEILSKKIMKAK